RISGPDWAGPLLDLLADRRKAPLHRLPRTGVPLRREWQLSSRFVRVGRWYGTRSTTAVRNDAHGTADVVERTWDARARIAGAVTAWVCAGGCTRGACPGSVRRLCRGCRCCCR